MGNVVVVGSSNTDMVLYTPEIPRPGETVMGSNFTVNNGGKGANQAVAAAKSLSGDASVYFVATVGNDDFGRQSLEAYRKNGVRTDYIVSKEQVSSGVALIFVADSSENTIGINSGANALLSADIVENALARIDEAEVMLTQLESPLETVIKTLELGKEQNIITILNPAPARELPESIFSAIDIITPNQTETEFYTGIYPDDHTGYVEAAEWFHCRGVSEVLITLGSRGLFYSSCNQANKEGQLIAPLKVKAVDTVGAGDTFNGAFASGLALGMESVAAIKFASVAAAISVTRLGAQKSAPVYSEIIEKLRE